MKDLQDYTQIPNPYNDFIDRRVENVSTINPDQAVRDGGVVNDLWVNSFIRSEDWSPDGGGFSLDGATGEATFSTITVNNIVNSQGGAVGSSSSQTYAPSAGGTATIDLSMSTEHRIIMPAGNITIAISGDVLSQKFIVSVLQDSVGSRTVTWFSTIRWAGGTTPTLTTAANKRDTFGFIRTGSGTYDGFIIGKNI